MPSRMSPSKTMPASSAGWPGQSRKIGYWKADKYESNRKTKDSKKHTNSRDMERSDTMDNGKTRAAQERNEEVQIRSIRYLRSSLGRRKVKRQIETSSGQGKIKHTYETLECYYK